MGHIQIRQIFGWSTPYAIAFFVSGLAFGVSAVGSGLGAGEATLMSALTFSGTAQLTTLQLWADPVPAIGVALAAASVNARYLALSASLAGQLGSRGPAKLASMGLLTDAGWLLTMRSHETSVSPWQTYTVSAVILWVAWVAGTWLGARHGMLLPHEWEHLVSFFALALLGGAAASLWRSRRDLVACAIGAAAALLADPFLSGSWHVLAGGLAGGSTALIRHD